MFFSLFDWRVLRAAQNFLALCASGYYNSTTFHRYGDIDLECGTAMCGLSDSIRKTVSVFIRAVTQFCSLT